MNRRNFIKLTGASTASLLISNYIKAENITDTIIQMPDEVDILLDKTYLSLQSSDRQTWTYKDVSVKLKKNKNSIGVFIQSPSLFLKEVKLAWRFPSPAGAKVLGDAWERTYGDMGFLPVNSTKKLPWYCIEHSGDNTVCFGVKTGCSAFCYWRVDNNHLELGLDVRNGSNGVSLGVRTLHAADIITTKNATQENVFATARRFCKMMCDKPLRVKRSVYGINDWYFAYGDNSAELILKHTSLLAPLATNTGNRPFSVIDDGWSLGTDYTRTNKKFPDMPKLAGQIKELGMHPGLWTRPLLAKPAESEKLFIHNAGNNKPTGVLDPTIEENIQSIKNLFVLYKQWGFEMVKHDYSTFDIFGKWGNGMNIQMAGYGIKFNDNSKTNAEIILNLYKSIRDASDDMYLIGCNTISHLSAGVFELNRIGDDTSGKEWERTKTMGVNTMAFRMIQHRNFYQVDGDCVGLTTAMPWEKNRQWMQLLAQSGAPLFISAQPKAVGKKQKDFIKTCFTDAAKEQPVGEPLDWMDNSFPAKWKLDNHVVEFDWS